MANTEIQPAVEFQALPLEFIVASPLIAAVKAQAMIAETTKGFITKLIDDKGKPITVDFTIAYKETDTSGKTQNKSAMINAPLLSLVPVPHLRIDSLTTHFKYEISQTAKVASSKDLGVDLEAKSGALLSPWVSASLKGSVSSKASEESTMNRSGVLEITVHASEAPIPEGLAKILNLLAGSIQSNLPTTAGK
jgi:hypothetical protein